MAVRRANYCTKGAVLIIVTNNNNSNNKNNNNVRVIIVHRCGTGGSMRACQAAGPGSIPGRDKFPG